MNQDKMDESARLRETFESLLKLKVWEALEKDFERNPRLKGLFQLTGVATRAEIRRKTGLANNIIAKTWASWYERGILRKRGRRYQKPWGD